MTTIIFSVLVLLTIIVFLFTIGLKILLNASVFVANLGQKQTKTSPLNKNQDFIGSIDVNDIPVATNSPRIIVSGSVVSFNQLEFYINGDIVKDVSLTASDNFSEEIRDLKKGDNEIYIIAKLKDQDQEKKSKVFSVEYKSDLPKLDISQPMDNAKTNQQEITVSGSTDKDTYVKINDLPIVVDAQGNFQTTVRLKDGDNKINVMAQDIAGNISSKTITVTYQKDY